MVTWLVRIGKSTVCLEYSSEDSAKDYIDWYLLTLGCSKNIYIECWDEDKLISKNIDYLAEV